MSHPQPPPPGWAGSDPASWQQPRRGPGLGLLIGVLAVLLVAGIGALVWVLATAGGPDPEEMTPTEVVEEFFQTLKEGECDALVDHLDTHLVREGGAEWREGAKQLERGCEQAGRFSGLLAYDVTGEDVDGDRAVVTVELGVDIPLAGEELPREETEIELEKVDGVWMYVDAGALDLGL